VQLAGYDDLTQQLIARAEKDIQPRIAIEHANARLAMKERQLGELSDAMRRLDPRDVLIEQYETAAAEAAREARIYRDETLREMQQQADREKQRMDQEGDERKRKMAQKLKYLFIHLLVYK